MVPALVPSVVHICMPPVPPRPWLEPVCAPSSPSFAAKNSAVEAAAARGVNLVMKEGDATIEEMIASTERGLLVNQFHYSNVVDPMALSITGMTRAGVWVIEGGELAYPVKNLRYTESLLGALSRIEAVGNIVEPTGGGLFGGGFMLAPMKINDFTFSSSTKF